MKAAIYAVSNFFFQGNIKFSGTGKPYLMTLADSPWTCLKKKRFQFSRKAVAGDTAQQQMK